MGTITLSLFMLFVPLIFGWTVLHLLNLKSKTLMDLPIAYITGYALSTYFIMFLGCTIGITRINLFLGMVILIVAAIWHNDVIVKDFKHIYYKLKFHILDLSKVDKILILLLLFIFTINLFSIFAPPTVADSLTYHYQIPLDYIRSQKIVYHSFMLYNSPHLTELFAVMPLAFSSEVSLQFSYYLFSVFLLVAILSFAVRYYSLNVGLLASMLFFSLPLLTNIFTSGHVEVALSLTSFLALISLINYYDVESKNDQSRWLLLSAIMAGISCGIKYYGLYTAVFVSIFVTVEFIRSKVKLITVSIFLLLISIFAVPFYLKNFMFTGNPLYPILSTVFDTKDWSYTHGRLFKEMVAVLKMPYGHDFLTYLLSPGLISLKNYLFNGLGNYFGPILLFSLPVYFLFIKKLKKPFFILPIFYGFFIWTVWFYSAFQRERHLVVVFLFLIIHISTLFFEMIKARRREFRPWIFGASIFLFVFLSFNYLSSLIYNVKFIKYVIRNESRDKFLSKYLSNWEDVKWVNENIPKDAKVLNYYGNINYYVDRSVFYPSPYFQGEFDFSSYLSLNEFYKQVKNKGFTHVITKYSYRSKPQADNSLKEYNDKYFKYHDDFIQDYTNEIYSSSKEYSVRRTLSNKTRRIDFYVYEIKKNN